MCGIAGIFGKHGPLGDAQLGELERMSLHMQRRGPDANGLWRSADHAVAFTHRRLAIIDPVAHADQPMHSPCGRYTITFNGEIYNFGQLRGALEQLGHTFVTRSDTEVVLHAFAHWGVACFARFRGMFAIAIWDASARTLTLARDPLGIKPLYVYENRREVRFASQVKTLVAGNAGGEANNAGLLGFLMLGSYPEPHTSYRDIVSLRAGEIRVMDAESTTSQYQNRWLDAWRDAGQIASNDTAVHEAIRDSIAAHLVSDVDVGLFLSSGIDSCALAAVAQEQSESAIKAVTLRFEDFDGTAEDEGPLAERFAAEIGLNYSEYRVSHSDVGTGLESIMDAMDQPSIDGFNTWMIAKAAAEHGMKVVLSGVGGDELFGGYPAFSRIPRWMRMRNGIDRVPGLGTLLKPLGALAARHGVISPKALTLLDSHLNVETCWLAQRSIFLASEVESLIGNERFVAALDELDIDAEMERVLNPRPASMELQISALESGFYLRNQLLRDADWASMDHSLELRTPLVDSTLYETVGPHLAGRSESNWNKDLIGYAPSKPLPDYILDRKKTGFVVPVERWLDQFEILNGWKRAQSQDLASGHWARRLAVAVLQPDCIQSGAAT